MKRITLTFAILLLIYAAVCAEIEIESEDIDAYPDSLSLIDLSSLDGFWESNLQLESSYRAFDRNASLQSRYMYTMTLPQPFYIPAGEGLIIHHEGSITRSKNDRFDRSSYFHDFNWAVNNVPSIVRFPVGYALLFSHNHASDKATPDGQSYELSRTRKRLGLDLTFDNSPQRRWDETFVMINSKLFYVRSDESQTNRTEDNTASGDYNGYGTDDSNESGIDSDGYHFSNFIRLRRDIEAADLALGAYIEQLSIDYDYLRNYGLTGEVKLAKPEIAADINFDKKTRQIYLLHDRIDTHVRTNYISNLRFKQSLAEGMYLRLFNRLMVRDNRLTQMTARNYLEVENNARIKADYQVLRFRFFAHGANRRFSREFRADDGSREQEYNSLDLGTSIKVSETDSLSFKRKYSLTQTDYRIGTSVLDSDNVLNENQISLYYFPRDRIRLVSHFNYTRREEIFLDAQMSGNNKVIRSYSFLPSLDIRFHRNLSLLQEYHLRADYDDYSFDWKHKPDDRMFRRFSAAYTVRTQFPAMREADISFSPSGFEEASAASKNNGSMLADVRYVYDISESGHLDDSDKYIVGPKNEFHTFEIDLVRMLNRIQLRARPRFIWSADNYEFNHIFQVNYHLPRRLGDSTLSINPTGRSTDDILWRVNFDFRFEW